MKCSATLVVFSLLVVDTEHSIQLNASDADGDPLTFGFTSPSANITQSLIESGDTAAVFTWTPDASDVGSQVFEFTVSDGQDTAEKSLTIEVRPPA